MSQAAVIAVVLAAGQGTRMKSSKPKVLHELCGIPLLGHAVQAVQGLNPGQLCVVIRHQKELVSEYLSSHFPAVVQAEQDDIPGTGRAVQCALMHFSELKGSGATVIVTSGDVPLLATETLTEMLASHRETKAILTVLTTTVPDATGYGRIVRDPDGELKAIVEHRDASAAIRQIREINAGIYAFDLDFLSEALAGIDQDNDQAEVYLTDTVRIATERGLVANTYHLHDSWQAEGCNDRQQLSQLAAELNRRLVTRFQMSGVTIDAPANTYLEPTVKIAADVRILPGTLIQGNTEIGAGSIIGPHTCLRNVTVGEGCELRYLDAKDCTFADSTFYPSKHS